MMKYFVIPTCILSSTIGQVHG